MRTKAVVMQRDFSAMEVRSDLLEADDSDLRARSLQSAHNMRQLASRAMIARPGTFFLRRLAAEKIFEIQPADGVTVGIVLRDSELLVVNSQGGTVHQITTVPWSSADDLWLQSMREETLIGDPETGIYVLNYNSGNWSLSSWSFVEAAGGETAQPYWAFNPGTSITPSARTGAITVTADANVFTPDHVGTLIRYGQREIEVTGFVTEKLVYGTVVTKLPPSFAVQVADVSEFRVGEVVVGQTTNYQGVITAIDVPSRTLSIFTVDFYDGPDIGENLSTTSASSAITIIAVSVPLATNIWDEQLMSAVHGWPRAASAAAGRIFLTDFPDVPSLIVCSSSRATNDFETGVEDDDAVVREVGDDAPRFLHAINAGDLILLSDRGCYQVALRDGAALTPLNFNPVKFDRRGANQIQPVLVDDSVVFVESNGQSVSAAVLSGDIHLKWKVRNLTLFHDHLVINPVALCGPSLGSPDVEKYMFVINGDGSIAAVSWSTDFGSEVIGFAPWGTDGTFVSVIPIFNSYWALVDRTTDAGVVRMLERFSEAAFVDSAVQTSSSSAAQFLTIDGENLTIDGDPLIITHPAPTHLPGKSVSYLVDDAYLGDFEVGADGTVTNEPEITGDRQIGLNFEAEIIPWPAELTDSARIGSLKARIMELIISVKDTLAFKVRCNGKERELGGFSFGDAQDTAPPRDTKVYRVPVFGRRDHPELAIIKDRPGPFKVLAIGQKVQG